MTRILQHKTSFTGGEIGPELYGRDDLRVYANGAARLRNVLVRPTGGVTRRPGLRHVAELPGVGRLIGFDFNAEQTYLVAAVEGELRIYLPGEAAPEATLFSPFGAEHLDGLDWTQSADTLLLVHPEVPPKQLVRRGAGDWRLEELPFAIDEHAGNAIRRVPFAKFGPAEARVQPNGTGGSVTLTATTELFLPDHIGRRFEIKGRQVEISGYTDSRHVTAVCQESLVDTQITGDWGEEAVSDLRGWPRSVVFHKDRLVIGGTRDLPHHVFMSRAGALFDFDTDEGQDDAAIDFPLMGDRVNAIQAVSSARHLQVFTSGGEWIVAGEPLTPTSVEVQPQTKIGSRAGRHVRPITVDGATMFVGPDGKGLYEFLYTDLEQAYSTVDLTLLVRHLVPSIRETSYDRLRRILYAVTESRELACLTQYRAEQVTAWTLCSSEGCQIESVATPGARTFLMVARPAGAAIEELDEALQVDAGLTGEADAPAATWSGLDHLEGEEVTVLADGRPRGRAVVVSGAVVLDQPARKVAIGKAFRHEVAPLPPVISNVTGRNPAAAVRLIETTLRLSETAQLDIDLGHGVRPVPLAGFAGPVLDMPPPRFSGDKRVRGTGWRRADTAPLWRLVGDAPLPLTLLSVTNEVKVND
jgi:hypothetical protein